MDDVPAEPPCKDQRRLVALRLALLQDEQAPPPPLPRRLIAHVLNAALLVVALPLGLVLTARALRRGADLGLSVRMTVTAGVVVALCTMPQADHFLGALAQGISGIDIAEAAEAIGAAAGIAARP